MVHFASSVFSCKLQNLPFVSRNGKGTVRPVGAVGCTSSSSSHPHGSLADLSTELA